VDFSGKAFSSSSTKILTKNLEIPNFEELDKPP
jgi:hypothetical protein